MNERFSWAELAVIMLGIMIFVISIFSGIFVDQSIAKRALENQGFTHVRVIDKQWFFVGMRGCGRDVAKFTAHAVNSEAKEVEVFVCVGWPFKGATVRSN